MQKVWSWRPSSSTGSRPASTSSRGVGKQTTFPSLKGAGKANRATIVCLDVNTSRAFSRINALYSMYCILKDCFLFFPTKLFLLRGKPESREAEIVNREKLWPHRHHWTWVPACSGFLAWAVQSRPWWLCQNHVGPHLRGYRTSRCFFLAN